MSDGTFQKVSIDETATAKKGFFKKLRDGDYGLAKTYWVFGVIVGSIVSAFFRAVPDLTVLKVGFLMYALYQVHVIMGVLNAASRYEGSAIWANLARIGVCLGGLMLLVNGSALLAL